MKKLLSILFLLTTLTATSQKDEIKVEVKESNGKLLFYCVNTTNVTQEVILSLTKHKGLIGYTKPLKKTLAKKGKKLFLTTTIKGTYSYNYSVNNKASNSKSKEDLLKKYPKINKGIVVFDKTDCPRCNFTTSYLIDNKIKFQHLKITGNEENNALMWLLLKKN